MIRALLKIHHLTFGTFLYLGKEGRCPQINHAVMTS